MPCGMFLASNRRSMKLHKDMPPNSKVEEDYFNVKSLGDFSSNLRAMCYGERGVTPYVVASTR